MGFVGRLRMRMGEVVVVVFDISLTWPDEKRRNVYYDLCMHSRSNICSLFIPAPMRTMYNTWSCS